MLGQPTFSSGVAKVSDDTRCENTVRFMKVLVCQQNRIFSTMSITLNAKLLSKIDRTSDAIVVGSPATVAHVSHTLGTQVRGVTHQQGLL